MRRRPTLGGEGLQHADGFVGVDVALDLHHERFAGELVDDVEQLQRPPVRGLIELKVECPYLVGPLGPQPLCRDGRLAQPPALASPLRHPQPLLAPQPLHPLAVHLPTLLA